MQNDRITDIECMLVVLYKKLDDIERKLKGSSRSASMSSYYEELKRDATKVMNDLSKNGLT